MSYTGSEICYFVCEKHYVPFTNEFWDTFIVVVKVQLSKLSKHKNVTIFLVVSLNMYFGCLKESSH